MVVIFTQEQDVDGAPWNLNRVEQFHVVPYRRPAKLVALSNTINMSMPLSPSTMNCSFGAGGGSNFEINWTDIFEAGAYSIRLGPV